MPTIKCPLKDCTYRGKRGGCNRRHIELRQSDEELNELFCLGWTTPETRLFTEVVAGRLDAKDKRQQPTAQEEK